MQTKLLPFVYRVIPLSVPKITRNGVTYTCTEKFRSNFNGLLGDIWLIYQTAKKHTWNLEIVSRKKINHTNSNGLFGKFQASDFDTVKKYAFDPDFIARNGAKFSPDLDFEVEGPSIDDLLDASGHVELHVTTDYFLPVKNKKILAHLFDMTGSRLETFYEKNSGFKILTKTQLSKACGYGFKVSLDVDKFKLIKSMSDENRSVFSPK